MQVGYVNFQQQKVEYIECVRRPISKLILLTSLQQYVAYIECVRRPLCKLV